MILRKLIFLFFIVINSNLFSQATNTNLDSLFTSVFKIVNQRDTNLYVSQINLNECFATYNVKSKTDSLKKINDIKQSFNILLNEFADMAFNNEPKIEYNTCEVIGFKDFVNLKNGKYRVHIAVLLNNQFIVKMPVYVLKQSNGFTIIDAIIPMFVIEKE